ncbi:MAG: CPBP family intramembrane metalloprotease [Clostridiales bacterium]|nr:CPBP family intramembrane metalloprotease [Clostridiales bacterium]
MQEYYYVPPTAQRNDEIARRNFERQRRIENEKHELRTVSCYLGAAIIAYLVIQTVASYVLMKIPNAYTLYSENSVFQTAFNIIAVSILSVALPFGVVALINKKRCARPIIPSERVGGFNCAIWVCFGMGCCIVSNVVVSFVVVFFESVFGLELTQGTTLEPDSVFACVMEVIGIAIIPAICEEFAMRCCSLQLLKKYGKGFAVFAVSTVFGLLHGNVIQFLFAFMIGCILGLMTVKTNSVIPAMLVHGFNNGMSALQSVVLYATGNEDISDRVITIIYLFWIVTGIISALVLLFKGEFKRQKTYQGNLTVGQRLGAFLCPGMIIPFAILILITASTVKTI